MDEVIKPPLYYGYPAAAKIALPLVPFFVIAVGCIGSGNDFSFYRFLFAAVPAVLLSALIAAYLITTGVTVTQNELIFRRLFSSSSLLLKDIKRIEIRSIGKGERFTVVSVTGKKYSTDPGISGYRVLLDYLTGIKNVEVAEYDEYGRRKK